MKVTGEEQEIKNKISEKKQGLIVNKKSVLLGGTVFIAIIALETINIGSLGVPHWVERLAAVVIFIAGIWGSRNKAI